MSGRREFNVRISFDLMATLCCKSVQYDLGAWASREALASEQRGDFYRLLELMKNRPWAYADPCSLISDNSCLVMTSDASGTAVAVSLFRVLKPDATTVTKDDLLDPTVSQLVGVCYKKLNTSQLQWHTFETELYAMVLGCKKFGSFITTATVKYPPMVPTR